MPVGARAIQRYVDLSLDLHELILTILQRPRRERSRERTPARTPARDTPAPRQKTPVPEQPPRDVRSGSEEGEIEEE